MPSKTTAVVALALAIGTHRGVGAAGGAAAIPTCRGSGRTGRSRRSNARRIWPASRSSRQPEAAEYERTWLEEFRKNFPPEDLQAPDIDYTYMDRDESRRQPADVAHHRSRGRPAAAAAPGGESARRRAPQTVERRSRAAGSRRALSAGNGLRVIERVAADGAEPVRAELLPDRPDRRSRADLHRGGPRRPDHPDRRDAPAAGGSAVARRFDRPLGRRDAGGRYHELHRQDALQGIRHRAARGRALHAHRARRRSAISSRRTIRRPGRGRGRAEIPFNATAERIFEYACHEGNYSMANVLRGARAEEKKHKPAAITTVWAMADQQPKQINFTILPDEDSSRRAPTRTSARSRTRRSTSRSPSAR